MLYFLLCLSLSLCLYIIINSVQCFHLHRSLVFLFFATHTFAATCQFFFLVLFREVLPVILSSVLIFMQLLEGEICTSCWELLPNHVFFCFGNSLRIFYYHIFILVYNHSVSVFDSHDTRSVPCMRQYICEYNDGGDGVGVVGSWASFLSNALCLNVLHTICIKLMYFNEQIN